MDIHPVCAHSAVLGRLAAATDMVGTTALMQEDILMAGYASLIGMSINFCVMFRLKFRFSNRVSLLACAMVLLIATVICAHTTNVALLVGTCFVAGSGCGLHSHATPLSSYGSRLSAIWRCFSVMSIWWSTA